MNVLALDTSTHQSAVAIERDDGQRFAIVGNASRRHGRELLPMIRDLLGQAGLAVSEIGAIGVGVGPGSYTGLRVGVTAAKMLAYTTRAAVVAFDSLEPYARAVNSSSERTLVLSDAQRGDFHVAEFGRVGEPISPRRKGPTVVRSRVELVAMLDEPATVVGPGVARWQGHWPVGVQVIDGLEPEPAILLDLVREAMTEGRTTDPWTLEPVYLRRSAAEDQWERRPA